MDLKIPIEDIITELQDAQSSFEQLQECVVQITQAIDLLDGMKSDEFVKVMKDNLKELQTSLEEACNESVAELLSNINGIVGAFEENEAVLAS